jgi:hypothetical protein
MRGIVTHREARNATLAVVNIVARAPRISELELVAALEKEGFSHLHAEKLCVFVPSAFGWALLKRMGLQSFPNHYVALDRFGREVKLPIASEHYFTGALQLAYETLEHGWGPILTKEDRLRSASNAKSRDLPLFVILARSATSLCADVATG